MKLLKNIIIVLLVLTSLKCSNSNGQSDSGFDLDNKTNEFIDIISDKEYTLLFFWTEWCGISRDRLINEFAANYDRYNNDSTQVFWVVMRDTSIANQLIKDKDFNFSYLVIDPNKMINPLSRNLKDERNKANLISNICKLKYTGTGFADLILINNKRQLLGYNLSFETFDTYWPNEPIYSL